ncbi:hypothetical protein [Rhizobium sullae]|uniref:hypothetical protein n=1 Tax=Rhizobium sullae TaxID=50338 RepID=UPI00117A2EEB|nr:hypothetical protein [Rhizobium sullae]
MILAAEAFANRKHYADRPCEHLSNELTALIVNYRFSGRNVGLKGVAQGAMPCHPPFRPFSTIIGLGSSLISVTSFVSSGVSALIFAVGTTITDYSGAAVLGAVTGLCAIGMLLFLDSSKRQVRQLA